MASYQPKVSIVIPVYNGANYVAEAIDSALGQTYPHIEVIVINDGSSDDGATARLAQSYGDKIRYFEKPNGGVATALNLGIEKMTGDYFSWLSHDDLYLPHKVERQVQFLGQLENRQVVLYSDYQLVDEKSKVTNIVHLDHQTLLAKPLYSVLRSAIHGCSTLVPRSAFEQCGSFDPELKTTQDYALWFRMARSLPFIHLPEVLISSRWHSEQGSKTNPAMLREANELWVGFADQLSHAEMLLCEPTVHSFYRELADFLSHSPYHEAQADIAARAEAERQKLVAGLETYKVSVICWLSESETARKALLSALRQSHRNLEILIVTAPSSALPSVWADDPRVRILPTPATNRAAARNMAIEAATGDYLTFLPNNAIWMPDRIALQLQETLLRGALVSYSNFQTLDQNGRVFAAANRSSVGSYECGTLAQAQAMSAATVMTQSRWLVEQQNLRFREDLIPHEETCLWLDLGRQEKVLSLTQTLTQIRPRDSATVPPESTPSERRFNILRHLADRDALAATPLESSDLLLATSRDLRALAFERLLKRAQQGHAVWPQAPIASRIVHRVGNLFNALPNLAKKLLNEPTQWLLLSLEKHHPKERLLRERRSRLAR